MSCVGRHSERGERCGQVLDQLFRGGFGDADIADQPALRAIAGRSCRSRAAIAARRRDTRCRQLVAAARRLAEPERDGRRLALRVLDPHAAALDAQDAVGAVAELEDVAGQALDGEVLVDAADRLVLGLQHHLVVGGVGDRAAGGQRGQPRAAPAAQHVVDRVAMDQRAAPAAAGGEAFGQHAHDGVEVLARESAIRPGAAHASNRAVLGPFLRRDLGDDLLRQHVERLLRDGQPIELAAAHAVEQRRAFDQVVARQREQPALRHAADRVAGAADALQEAGDRARRAELADQVDVADVDAELQRRGGHQHLQLAALQPLLGVEALLLRQAAVVRGDRVFAEPLATTGAPRARPCAAC